jgi:hypothetical protein
MENALRNLEVEVVFFTGCDLSYRRCWPHNGVFYNDLDARLYIVEDTLVSSVSMPNFYNFSK